MSHRLNVFPENDTIRKKLADDDREEEIRRRYKEMMESSDASFLLRRLDELRQREEDRRTYERFRYSAGRQVLTG